ncbi:MAG: glycosyltransferase family 39 protein [Elusimicrobiota bacterium]|jgi:uncharacterized membrane protein
MSYLASLDRVRRSALYLFAAGALLRLIFATSRSLWFDEANTLAVAAAPLADLPRLVRTLEGFPPLHYLLLHLWLPLWADPLVGLRMFSVTCGLGALAAFWPLSRRLAPGQEHFALGLAALSSFWIHTAQDGRVYALFLLLGLAACSLLWDLAERWSLGKAAAYAAVSTAGMYSHNFFLLLLLANAGWLILRHRKTPARLLPWLAMFGLIALLYLPWLASLLTQVRNWSAISALAVPLSLSQLLYLLGSMILDTGFLGFAHEGATRVIGGAVLTSALGLITWRRSSRPDQARMGFCLVHILAPLAAAKLMEIMLGKPVTQTRYLICVSPFLYLWLAWAAGRISGRWGRALRAGLLGLLLLGAAAYHASGRILDTRLSALAEAIRRGSSNRAPVIHMDAYYYTPLRYYYLPERAHYLLAPGNKNLNWPALPGYPAAPGPAAIGRMGDCVAVDPWRKFSRGRLILGTGAQLQGLAGPQQP